MLDGNRPTPEPSQSEFYPRQYQTQIRGSRQWQCPFHVKRNKYAVEKSNEARKD